MRKRRVSKSVFAVLTVAALSAAMAIGTMAEECGWRQDGLGWRWRCPYGSYVRNSWAWLDGNYDDIYECYRFDEKGYIYMNTTTPDGYTVDQNGAWTVNGVVQTTSGMWKQEAGKWYYNTTGESRIYKGWFWIDGNKDGMAECYCFGEDTYLLTSTTTPDGYTVDQNGAWTVNGVVQSRNVKEDNLKLVFNVKSPEQKFLNEDTSGSNGNNSGGSGNNSNGNNSGGSYSDSGSQDGYYTSDGRYITQEEAEILRRGANDPIYGNASEMSWDERDAVKAAIEDFKSSYISDEMSDFEKEMKIIEWLVENTEYDKADNWDKATAYSAIIGHEAQCAGYADAFLHMARACGLEVRYVLSPEHAWNLIKLDGEWYHVDVTWEDPAGLAISPYGFGNLCNEYINITDAEIRKAEYHKTWSPKNIKARGKKYGKEAVNEYLNANRGDYEPRERYEELLEVSEHLTFKSVEETSDEILEILDDVIENRRKKYFIVIDFEEYEVKYDYEFRKVHDFVEQMDLRISEVINSKYEDVLARKYNITFGCGWSTKYDVSYAELCGSFKYKK